jgi:hypothetical protein
MRMPASQATVHAPLKPDDDGGSTAAAGTGPNDGLGDGSGDRFAE